MAAGPRRTAARSGGRASPRRSGDRAALEAGQVRGRDRHWLLRAASGTGRLAGSPVSSSRVAARSANGPAPASRSGYRRRPASGPSGRTTMVTRGHPRRRSGLAPARPPRVASFRRSITHEPPRPERAPRRDHVRHVAPHPGCPLCMRARRPADGSRAGRSRASPRSYRARRPGARRRPARDARRPLLACPICRRRASQGVFRRRTGRSPAAGGVALTSLGLG